MTRGERNTLLGDWSVASAVSLKSIVEHDFLLIGVLVLYGSAAKISVAQGMRTTLSVSSRSVLPWRSICTSR